MEILATNILADKTDATIALAGNQLFIVATTRIFSASKENKEWKSLNPILILF